MWYDTVAVIFVFAMLILFAWSRIMNQKIYDTVIEIRDILRDLATGKK